MILKVDVLVHYIFAGFLQCYFSKERELSAKKRSVSLKPPSGVAIENFFSIIWDTSHWNFFLTFGHKTQDSLWHLLGPFLVNFDICQFLATSGPLQYFCQNWVSSEKSIFSWYRATRLWQGLGFLEGQIPRLYGGIFWWECNTLRDFQQGIENKGSVLWHICNSLKGTQHSLIWSRTSP